jgi:type I restriction enzyme S subunit
MSEWKEYKLGDIIDVRDGTHDSPKQKDNGKPLVTSKHIKGGKIDLSTAYLISIDDFDKINKRSKVDKWDVLFSMIGTIGEMVIVKEEPDFAIKNVGLFKAKDEYTSKWIYYYLKSPKAQSEILSSLKGSTQQYISLTDLRNFPVTFPSINEGWEIIQILSSLDDKIELNNKINQELETLAQTLFKQWFIDFEFPNENGEPYKSSGGEMVESELGEIPKGWEVGYLEDVIEFHNGYAFSSKELESESSTDSYHVFKMGHIKKGGGLNAEGTKSYFSKSKAQKLSKYVLKKGDLLMCMTDMKGNVALLGHTALMNENDKYIVNQRVGLLRPNNSFGIDYPYLYILTNSFDFIEELRSRANSGVQVNLSTNEIKKSKILIASKSINEKFDLVTQSFYNKIFEITNENQTLRNTRDTLLPKLISGELILNEISNQ